MVKTNSSIKTFWTIFFAVLAVLAIGVAVAFAVMPTNSDVADGDVLATNDYNQALYAVCDGMKNLDADLGKASVSTNSKTQAMLLTKVVVCANAVNQSFADLPVEQSEKLASCNKFVNQAQDYATYLIGKLASGRSLTKSERASLVDLNRASQKFYAFLSDFDLQSASASGVDFNDGFQQVDSQAFDYEKLIYDGPFSDSVEQQYVKCGNDVGQTTVAKELEKVFGKTQFLGTIDYHGKFYRYQTDLGVVTATCSGKVAEFDGQNYDGGNVVSSDEAISVAEEFCRKLGYDVDGIWVSRSGEAVTYVNCATVSNGVIVYPELIKVAVGAGGKVVGLEAKAYLTNRSADRKIDFGQVTERAARQTLSDNLSVQNAVKCLILKDGKTYSAWEFECSSDGRQYYVYVDSSTGEELEIFKVVEQTEGHTVL